MEVIVKLTRKVEDIKETIEMIREIREEFDVCNNKSEEIISKLNWEVSSSFKPEQKNIESAEAMIKAMLEAGKASLICAFFASKYEEASNHATIGVASENGDAFAIIANLDEVNSDLTVTLFANCTRFFLACHGLSQLYCLGFKRKDFEVDPVVYNFTGTSDIKWFENKGEYLARRYTESKDIYERASIEMKVQSEIIRCGNSINFNIEELIKLISTGEPILMEVHKYWVNFFVNELTRRNKEEAKSFAQKAIQTLQKITDLVCL